MLFRVIGFKPDLNESIAMMEKSNKRKLIATLDSMYPCILHQHNITIFFEMACMHTVCPHPLTSLNIGKCYLYINKKDEAKKWLEEAANFKSSQTQSEGVAHAHVSPF